MPDHRYFKSKSRMIQEVFSVLTWTVCCPSPSTDKFQEILWQKFLNMQYGVLGFS